MAGTDGRGADWHAVARAVNRSGVGDSLDADILRPLRPDGSRTPLFLIHPSGGSSLPYIPLVRHLDQDQPAIGIDAVGLASGTTPDDADKLVRCYLGAVLRIQPAGPYRLAGWSVGGVFAFDLAVAMRASGRAVSALVLIDSFEPPDPARVDSTDLLLLFADGLIRAQEPAGASKALPTATELRSMPWAEQHRAVLSLLADTGVVPPGAEDFVQDRMNVFNAIMAAAGGRGHRTYDGRIDLLHAAQSPGREMSAYWSARTTGRVARHELPGDHYTMMRPPIVEHVARALQGVLPDEAMSQVGGADAG
jgi:thioesterase domain-containing protein